MSLCFYLVLVVFWGTISGSLLPCRRSAGYCKLCKNHIACHNSGRLAATCSADAKVLKITSEVKARILDVHNELRNRQAKGKIPRYPPATRMTTVKWSNELARLALLNALRCDFSHDECRKTKRFAYAGQNIAFDSAKLPLIEIVSKTINAWFDEYKNTNVDVISSYHKNADGTMNGHYTQIVRDISYKVGCAASKFQYRGYYVNYLACDYAVTNILDRPIYDVGRTASKCKTGTNPKYNGLCSENEIYESQFIKI